MRRLILSVAIACAASMTSAQNLDVDFQITEDGQAAGCLGATVTGLDPNGDGFLSVRTGPGTEYRKIDEVYNGDQVRPCAQSGKWWGIYYGEPRKKGWVHGNWLGGWAG